MMSPDEEALWERYRRTGDVVDRNALVERYYPLLVSVALKFNPRDDLERDTLVSHGALGLIEAVESFDIERGSAFSSFAFVRIRGAVKDGLRRDDLVSRSARQEWRAVEAAESRLAVRLGREASSAELAAELEITVDRLRRIQAGRDMWTVYRLDKVVVSNGDARFGHEITLAETVATEEDRRDADGSSPELEFELAEAIELLADALDAIPALSRVVLGLTHREGLNLGQAGAVLGLSRARVCQLRSRALAQLREALVA